MFWTIGAAASAAMVAMNTWGIQCPRPIWLMLIQISVAVILWTMSSDIRERDK